MIKAINVAGARPNFMKIGPLHRRMVGSPQFDPIFVHTGQHYDANMSQVFLDEFGLPPPDHHIDAGSGTHAEQTARVLMGMEPIIERERPDVVIVVGDVNSTLAAALAAAKLHVPVAHVEAGLRSFDRAMPEEINRRLTDALSDYLFAPSADAIVNLEREGISPERVFLVGNIMIDTLVEQLPQAHQSHILERLELDEGNYVVATLHRPATVDDGRALEAAVAVLERIGRVVPAVLVAHPRTRQRLSAFGLIETLRRSRTRVVEPLGYLDFLRLLSAARAAFTDSGGIQEETTFLGVPCVTMRTTTERPITVEQGTNQVVGLDRDRALRALELAIRTPPAPRRPHLWDGRTAERILDVLIRQIGAPRPQSARAGHDS